MSVIPQTPPPPPPRASGGLGPPTLWVPRLLTPPLTTNPGSAPESYGIFFQDDNKTISTYIKPKHFSYQNLN